MRGQGFCLAARQRVTDTNEGLSYPPRSAGAFARTTAPALDRRILVARPKRLMNRAGSRLRCRVSVLRLLPLVAVVACASVFTSTPRAADPPVAASATALAGSFDTVVKPFLTHHCIRCHGPMKENARVTFHNRDGQCFQYDRDLWETGMQRLRHGGLQQSD